MASATKIRPAPRHDSCPPPGNNSRHELPTIFGTGSRAQQNSTALFRRNPHKSGSVGWMALRPLPGRGEPVEPGMRTRSCGRIRPAEGERDVSHREGRRCRARHRCRGDQRCRPGHGRRRRPGWGRRLARRHLGRRRPGAGPRPGQRLRQHRGRHRPAEPGLRQRLRQRRRSRQRRRQRAAATAATTAATAADTLDKRPPARMRGGLFS